MPDERKETGQKFSSGKAYQENKTDFSSFLHINNNESNEKDSKKENNYTKLLQKAMEDNDSEFDELEKGFEEEAKKIETPITVANKQEIKKPETPTNIKENSGELHKTETNINHEQENNHEQISNNIGKEEINKNLSEDEVITSKDGNVIITREELFKSIQEINNKNVKGTKIIETLSENSFAKDGSIKRRFNPNPPKDKIANKNFNDPSLDDIYMFDYPDDIIALRKRKSEERQKKIDLRKKEEEEFEKLKQKRNSKKKKTYKPKKPLNVPDKYPKIYYDPTDEEIDAKTGKPYYYFNFTKTLRNGKLWFLEKILPTKAIDDVLYDKGFLDGVADRQHEKSVRLNNMSAAEQYSRDLRNMGILIAVLSVFIIATFGKITLSIVPDKKYEVALNTLNTKDYENAYYQFTELGNKNLSIYYAKYSEAKMYYSVEKYKEAKEAFTLLQPYGEDVFKPLGINIDDEISECSYQIALSYYYANDYESAKNIFKDIYTYSDATEKYYECGYKIAKEIYENWQDIDDLKKSLKYFYKVRKYTTSDVSSYMTIITDTLYGKAENFYMQKDYKNALDIYSYLALFNYVNTEDNIIASDMVSQCTYRYGLDLYMNRQYESARKALSEIPEYKDSYVLAKECIYNIASILYENNPVGSIAEYQKIVGYKNSDDTLYSSRLLPYGKWKIIEMNKSSITPISFNFYDDGQFRTNKQILSVAISTEASPQYYSWNGTAFATESGEYLITCSFDKTTNRMTMTCQSPTQTVEYTCQREMSYEEMILSENNSGNTETGEETLNQKFKTLIQEYVDKKLDNEVTIDGESVKIFDEK